MSSPEAPAPTRPSRFGRFFWRDPNTQFLLLAAAVGVVGALGAISFRFISIRLTQLLLDAEDIVSGAESLPPLLRIFLPALGGLVGGLIAKAFVAGTGATGISHMIEVVNLGRRSVRVRPSLGRAAASLAVISTGGSEGREGTIIQMGAAFASWLSRLVKVSPERMRILTACGMAAGVAGAYNTPIAATLFVLEVVVGSFSMTLFGPAVVSAAISTVLVRFLLGDEPVYHVAAFRLESALEFLPFAVIGVAAGAASAFFVRALRAAKAFFTSFGLALPVSMAIGGAIVGLIGVVRPEVWGSGFAGTNRILRGNPSFLLLVELFIAKIAATAATIGSGGVGGVFTPALMIGASLGGVAAKITELVFPWIDSPVGGYALLGMGGLLAGVTRAPLLAIIMIFELTQNTAVLLPMMAVSVLAVLSARALQKDSMYVQSLRSAGIVWEKTPEATALSSLRVSDVMREDVKLVPRNMTLPEIVNVFLHTRSLYLYVGDDEGRLLGVVDLHDIKESLPERNISSLVIAEDLLSEIPFVTPSEPLTSVNEKLWFRDLGQLPVVETAENRRFLGVVTRRDLLGAFDREVLQHSRLVARVEMFREGGSEMDYFELPEKHRLLQVDIPPAIEGRTVAESGLRTRYGVSVLAVKRLTREGLERRFVPGPADRLQHGDVLIVLGTEDALARLKAERFEGLRVAILVAVSNKGVASEFVALRGKWQKERSRLYDRDTGLPTVAAIMDDLVLQLTEQGSLSILAFCPGSEGRVEEVWGSKAYDDLLLDFVRRVKAFQSDGIVPSGTLCLPHVSSDEVLLVLAPETGSIDSHRTIEQRAAELDQLIRGYLAERADLSGRFRSFVGAARVHGDPRRRPERLLYRGIQEARDRVTRQTVRAEIRGAALLQEAINKRDFTSVFQPVFGLVSGEMMGMEALSRGPKGSEFEGGETLFSLADRTDLLAPLERVCRDISLEVAAAAPLSRGTGLLFLNLSPAAASDPEFLGPRFREQVESLGLKPESIVLEITERTYVVYESLFREVLSRFREQNFRIAVDDVGTGYSSLSSLADIKPDYLKFDHVFVRDIDRRPIKQDLLEALMVFARKMNTRVIGEGIETRDELHALRGLGVELGQGFLLAPPMPIEEIPRFAKVAV